MTMRSLPSEPAEVRSDLAAVRAAVPAGCRQPSLPRSLAHLAFDVAVTVGLLLVGARLLANGWGWALPVYWLAQGSMFWALFILGHDAGHGSFARKRSINTTVGYLVHTPFLVPYQSWRITHRTHHTHTAHVREDESNVPMTKRQFDRLPAFMRWYRKALMYTAVSFPLYLLMNNFGRRRASHFLPRSPLFRPQERSMVRNSSLAVLGMVLVLIAASFAFGLVPVIVLYGVPYVVFCQWFIITTYLHHTDPTIPWYHDEDWDRFTGNLSTMDRSNGWLLDNLHHHIGLHVAHHMMPTIPHYHLVEATAAIRPVLGDAYRSDDEFFLRAYFRTARVADYVPDGPGPVYFEPAP